MTESEYLACADPARLLEWLRGDHPLLPPCPQPPPSDRKLRLFACACCRQAWDHLADPRCLRAVEVAERYADGEATEAERVAAADTANFDAPPTCFTCYVDPADGLNHIARLPVANPALQAALLREIVGNPYHAATLRRVNGRLCQLVTRQETPEKPRQRVVSSTLVREVWCHVGWLTPTVRRIARGAYADRDWGTLPVLADALEEAGCEEERVLGHLRGPGPHVRGCWVVDRLLGLS